MKDIEQPHYQKAHQEKARRPEDGIRKEGPHRVIGLTVTGQQQSRDKLGAHRPQADPQQNRHAAHQKGLGEKQPGDGSLLHSHHSFQCKFLLAAAKHIAVCKADQKKQQKGYAADGHFHAVAEHRIVVFCPNVRLVKPAGNGQKPIKQGRTDGHGKDVDQIIPGRAPGAAENQFSVHSARLLPAWPAPGESSQRRRPGSRRPAAAR